MKKASDRKPVAEDSDLLMFSSGVRFVGWNTAGTSDKIWGFIRHPLAGEVTFWGRRQGPWTFKRLGSYAGGTSSKGCVLMDEKRAGGYDETSLSSLGIEKDLFDAFVRAALLQNFHGG